MHGTIDHSRLAALPRRERILLWTMRAWVMGITEKIPVEEQIHDAFSRVGAPDATGQLFGFMWILSHGASRRIDVDCVCGQRISADERRLLDILALCQENRTFEAVALLRTMVTTGPVAVAAAESAGRVAGALSAAGFLLPPHPLETTRYMFAANDGGAYSATRTRSLN